MRFSIAILVLSLFTVACTHRYDLSAASPRLLDKRVTMTLTDGRTVEATLEPAPGGLVWRTDSGQLVTSEQVYAVKRTSHGRGAFEGFGLGLLIGAGIGATMGLADGDDPPCDDCLFNLSAGDKAVLLGGALGIVGSVTGLIVGAAVGSREEYTYRPGSEWIPHISASSAPGGASATAVWSF